MDTPELKKLSNLKIGFDYIVIRNEIRNLANSFIQEKIEKKLIISLGGADSFDMVSKVIKSLKSLSNDFYLQIILGELYKHEIGLKRVCSKYLSCEYDILRAPKDFPKLLASCDIGIFGSGVVCYEAMFLGVIPLNFGHSDFHELRAKEIEKREAGFYIGDFRYGETYPGVVDVINMLYADKEILAKTKKNAMNAVDGVGLTRIIKIVNETLWK